MTPGAVSLTPAGTAWYTRLRDRIDLVTCRIFEQFDAERVETARSLLQQIAKTDPEELTHRSVGDWVDATSWLLYVRSN